MKTEKEAQAVLDRLSKGEKFSNIAKEVSRRPGSGKRGGDLGWFTRGKMVKEFEQAVFRAPERTNLTQRENTIRISHYSQTRIAFTMEGLIPRSTESSHGRRETQASYICSASSGNSS